MSTSNLKQKQRRRNKVGLTGEQLAADYLQKHHYQIWKRRFRAGKDEIDLIAFDERHQEIVFVEVKTRASDDVAEPEEQLSPSKLAAMQRAGSEFLKLCPTNYDYRFDFMTVLPKKISHYENVTWP